MIRRLLGILIYLILFTILVLPFYFKISFLNIFIPYLITAISFVFIFALGFKISFTYFLLSTYVAISLIFFSYYNFNHEILTGMILGLISSICIFFSRGMDSYE